MGGGGENVKRTATDQAVHKRLLAAEHILVDDEPPVIGVAEGEGVLEEVDVGALVALVAEEVAPVGLDDLGGGVAPGLEVLGLDVVDAVQVRCVPAQQVRRAQDVRHVVVIPQIVVHHRVVHVVRPQQVLQRPRPLLRRRLHIVNRDRRYLDRRAPGAREQPVHHGDVRE